jgi:hypothetical protein
MKNWLQKNIKNIIVTAFVIPILLVAFVSISHVTSFYGLSNPISWAAYLSIGIEIAALSALAAVSVNMGRFVYVPFFVVTFIQMIGNIFFSFTYIDETGQSFQDWVAMVGGLFENMGIEKTDLNSHKTIVAFLSGGLLPIISLTFAHMLVKFSEQNEEIKQVPTIQISESDLDEISKKISKEEIEKEIKEKYTPTEEDIKKIHDVLKYYDGPIENISNDEPIKPTEEELNTLQNVLNNMEPVNIENNPEQVETGKNMENAFIDYSNNMEINNNDVNQDNNEIRPEHKTLVYIKPNASN